MMFMTKKAIDVACLHAGRSRYASFKFSRLVLYITSACEVAAAALRMMDGSDQECASGV